MDLYDPEKVKQLMDKVKDLYEQEIISFFISCRPRFNKISYSYKSLILSVSCLTFSGS